MVQTAETTATATTVDTDTIVAVATAPGRGGVGVVRLSGPQAMTIAAQITRRQELPPRLANYSRFFDTTGTVIDSGLVIAFPGPASFTGEDVVELQGHGSPVMLDTLVRTAIELGARMARPGEFSERAYLNGKMDLAQAEAVADLIDASSEASARAAVRSLQGEFSRLMHGLSETLVRLRVQVEAAIDFPDEDIELLAAPGVTAMLEDLIEQVDGIIARTRSGVRLTEGARLVLVGAPNVGKSSVLNRLCGEERAIVTDIAGTTRDLLREQLQLQGIPVELVDTAGLRETDDAIEAEGVRRAETAARDADLVLAVYDVTDESSFEFLKKWLSSIKTERSFYSSGGVDDSIVVIANKTDLSVDSAYKGFHRELVLTNYPVHPVSAVTGSGIRDLTERLVEKLTGGKPGAEGGANAGIREDTYSARSRHLQALAEAATGLADAQQAINEGHGAELVAEHLRHAQAELGSVCGDISSDALLGEIFSSFCIGK